MQNVNKESYKYVYQILLAEILCYKEIQKKCGKRIPNRWKISCSGTFKGSRSSNNNWIQIVITLTSTVDILVVTNQTTVDNRSPQAWRQKRQCQHPSTIWCLHCSTTHPLDLISTGCNKSFTFNKQLANGNVTPTPILETPDDCNVEYL